MAYQEKQLQEISKQFQIYGEILHAETFKIGHINETYSATYDQGGMRVRYIAPEGWRTYSPMVPVDSRNPLFVYRR